MLYKYSIYFRKLLTSIMLKMYVELDFSGYYIIQYGILIFQQQFIND